MEEQLLLFKKKIETVGMNSSKSAIRITQKK